MLLRWGQTAFRNFRVVPPDTGIVHQVNLEYLASVVFRCGRRGLPRHAGGHGFPHHHDQRPGRAGLGRGRHRGRGLHAGPAHLHAAAAGGRLQAARAACAKAAPPPTWCSPSPQMLRKKGVVGKFVEFYGPGLSALSLADRATVANMAPEYGATMGFFPVDRETLAYLRSPTARRSWSRWSKPTRASRACSAPTPRPTRCTPIRSSSISPPWFPPWPVPSGRRTAWSCPTSKEFFRGIRRRAEIRPDPDRRLPGIHRQRRGGDRRHHQLHQHLEPVGDAGAPACWPRRPWSAASPPSRG